MIFSKIKTVIAPQLRPTNINNILIQKMNNIIKIERCKLYFISYHPLTSCCSGRKQGDIHLINHLFTLL